jgi:hypothetical protein
MPTFCQMFSIDFPSISESIKLISTQKSDLNFTFSSKESLQIFEILSFQTPKFLLKSAESYRSILQAKRIDLLPLLYGWGLR